MLLFVDCCISRRGDRSRSHALAEAFLTEFRKTHPDEKIETVNLQRMALRPVDQFIADDRNTLRNVKAFGAPIFKLPNQFRSADKIMVAAPVRDFTFPAMLRTYIEYVSVRDLTYHFDENGKSVGDCAGDKLAYLCTSGANEEEQNLGIENWKSLCRRFGIKEFYHVSASGLDFQNADERAATMERACQQAAEIARNF